MKIHAIIPARLGASRLPAKPLADIGGQPMIVHTMRAATAHPDIEDVCVATDHADIAEAVRQAGGEAILTRTDHTTGTDRCLEAWQTWGRQGAVINLQGDEPFPDDRHISAVCALLREGRFDVATVMRPAERGEQESPHRVKVAAGMDGQARYFSRSPIPNGGPFHIHLGIYGFTEGALERCALMPPEPLEQSERLEQLRWLAGGVSIGITAVPGHHGPGPVDTPEDLEKVRRWFAVHGAG